VTDARLRGDYAWAMGMGAIRLAAVAALCVATAACGRAGTSSVAAVVTPAATAVSSSPASPEPTPTGQPGAFTIPGVLACTPSDLDVRVKVPNPSYVGGASDSIWWALDMTDVGPRPCYVGPTPNVSFYAASGQLAVPKADPWAGDIVYLTPANPEPPYFGSASGEIAVSLCDAAESVDHVVLDLGASLGTVTVSPGPAGGSGNECPESGKGYFTELYGVPNDGSIGGYSPLKQTTVVGPPSAQPGERVHFVVTLDNTPGATTGMGTRVNGPWSFTPCPLFSDEVEGVVGTFQVSSLDCAALKTIPPNGQESFDAYIDIPSDATPGPATLVWGIVGSPAEYGRGSSYLPIT
jgi:hypothetical protein